MIAREEAASCMRLSGAHSEFGGPAIEDLLLFLRKSGSAARRSRRVVRRRYDEVLYLVTLPFFDL